MIPFEEIDNWQMIINRHRQHYEDLRQKYQNRSSSDDLSVDNPLSLADDVIYINHRVPGNIIFKTKS